MIQDVVEQSAYQKHVACTNHDANAEGIIKYEEGTKAHQKSG